MITRVEKIDGKYVERILLDLKYCIGCRSCTIACSMGHHHQGHTAMADVKEIGILPLHCRHCEEPACVPACPVSAMEKREDGLVKRNNQICIGCGSCMLACPFGSIAAGLKNHIPAKCDQCLDRLNRGERPRCVTTCVAGALKFEKTATMPDTAVRVGGRFLGSIGIKRR
jgi:Fe-S-cluster-containing dehydrogenase component